MVLHGIYDHGIIKINEKKLPNLKTKVDIYLYEDSKNKHNVIKTILNEIRKKKIFSDISDPIQWQRNIRNEW